MRGRRLVSGFAALAVLFSAAWCACAGPHVAAGPAVPVAHECCGTGESGTSAPLTPVKAGNHDCRHCGTSGSFEMPGAHSSAPTPFDHLQAPFQTPMGAVVFAPASAERVAVIAAETDTPPPTLLNLRCALLR